MTYGAVLVLYAGRQMDVKVSQNTCCHNTVGTVFDVFVGGEEEKNELFTVF